VEHHNQIVLCLIVMSWVNSKGLSSTKFWVLHEQTSFPLTSLCEDAGIGGDWLIWNKRVSLRFFWLRNCAAAKWQDIVILSCVLLETGQERQGGNFQGFGRRPWQGSCDSKLKVTLSESAVFLLLWMSVLVSAFNTCL